MIAARQLSKMIKMPSRFGFAEKLDRFFENKQVTGLTFSLKNRTGALSEVLEIFQKYNIDLSYISSRPKKTYRNPKKTTFDFKIDAKCPDDDMRLEKAMIELKKVTSKASFTKVENVPWFPTCRMDLNKVGKLVSGSGSGLESDHPGFSDPVYVERRKHIASKSDEFIFGINKVPIIEYTQEEKDLWKKLWDMVVPLQYEHACDEHIESFNQIQRECEFNRESVPQIQDINEYLKKTDFMLRPVAGLLTQREFLNSLAFRVFHSTQYIRHSSQPLYTPEPDIIHEFLGHASLLGDKNFADFTQEIGLASLGASDEECRKLGDIYWFTVEFGLVKQRGERKIYGAGILSSVDEIKWSLSDKPTVKPFELEEMAHEPYVITEVQKVFYEAESFQDMIKKIRDYSDRVNRDFNVSYDTIEGKLEIDRRIKTRRESSTPQGDKLF